MAQMVVQYFQCDDGSPAFKEARFFTLILINDVINYAETFSTSGNPKTWCQLLVLSGERGDDSSPNVYDYGVLIKEMAGAEHKQVKDIIKKFRSYLQEKMLPSFISNYLSTYKGLYSCETMTHREKLAAKWASFLVPFEEKMMREEPLDYKSCMQEMQLGLQLLVWVNIPCNQNRMAHLSNFTKSKLFDPADADEEYLASMLQRFVDELQNEETKIADIESNGQGILDKFTSCAKWREAIVLMTLKIFTRFSTEKADLRYTVRSWAAQDREILAKFFTAVLGKTEGRVALSSVELLISKISP